jgi:predicted aldo/keto reductase-like oxidoreductase
MRLPTLEQNRPAAIDERSATAIIRHAIDRGVNYVDTAYMYHSGASEVAVGKALRDGYRNRIRIATKLPTLLVKSDADFDKFLAEQLRRLQTDHIDFYLLFYRY